MANRYINLIEKIFFDHFEEGITEFTFKREELVEKARKLEIDLPKNLGDIIYTFRYRAPLPQSIVEKAKKDLSGKYYRPGKDFINLF